MTVAEFKEAMKTDAMKEEFAALLNERNVLTVEALIVAMADFAESKGCHVSVEKAKARANARELDGEELDAVSGGKYSYRDISKDLKEDEKFGLPKIEQMMNPISTVMSWLS